MSFRNISVPVKLYILTGVFSLGLIGYGLWSNHTLSVSKVNGPYYKKIVEMKDVLADILPPPEYILEGYLASLTLAEMAHDGEASPAEMAAAAEEIRSLQKQYEDRHDFWNANMADSEIKAKLMKDTHDPAAEFFNLANERLIPACLAGKGEEAQKIFEMEMVPVFRKHKLAINDLAALT